MKVLDTINPHDWQTVEPHYHALLAEPLTAAQVPDSKELS